MKRLRQSRVLGHRECFPCPSFIPTSDMLSAASGINLISTCFTVGDYPSQQKEQLRNEDLHSYLEACLSHLKFSRDLYLINPWILTVSTINNSEAVVSI